MKKQLAVFLLMSSTALADDSCTFDRQHQIDVIKVAVARIPGGKVSVDPTIARWKYAGGGKVVFSYGGCADLGSSVTLSEPRKTAKSKEAILASALELAKTYWTPEIVGDPMALEAVTNGIEAATQAGSPINWETGLELTASGFVELYVSHKYAKGVDVVSINYQSEL